MPVPDFNPHPFLSSFPVVFLLTAVTCELACVLSKNPVKAAFYRQAFLYLLSLAAIAAIFAFFSGYIAADAALAPQTPDTLSMQRDGLQEHIEAHHDIGRFLLMACLPLTAFAWLREFVRVRSARESGGAPENRFIGLNTVVWTLLIVSTALVLWTGRLGGELVFKHGAGVEFDRGGAMIQELGKNLKAQNSKIPTN